MNDAEFKKLIEMSWRRTLSSGEEARLRDYFASNPEARATWEEESALNHALAGSTGPAVSSNFTAQVMQAIEREESAISSTAWAHWRDAFVRFGFGRRVAFAAVLLGLGLLTYQQVVGYHRTQLRLAVESLSQAGALPSEVWENFDRINLLGDIKKLSEFSANVDLELLELPLH